LDWAEKLSIEELREAIGHLSFKLKIRMREEAHRAAILLRTGDWVENLHEVRKLPAGARGHITEIRRDKIDVHFPEYGHYTMPASLVRKTESPPAMRKGDSATTYSGAGDATDEA
jgi:hypothetical protein